MVCSGPSPRSMAVAGSVRALAGWTSRDVPSGCRCSRPRMRPQRCRSDCSRFCAAQAVRPASGPASRRTRPATAVVRIRILRPRPAAAAPVSRVQQAVGADQGGAEQRKRGGGNGGSGERRDQDVGAGTRGDVSGKPAAGQHEDCRGPEALCDPGRPSRTRRPGRNRAARASSSTGSPASRASRSAQGAPPADPPKTASPVRPPSDAKRKRLAQDLLPERCRRRSPAAFPGPPAAARGRSMTEKTNGTNRARLGSSVHQTVRPRRPQQDPAQRHHDHSGHQQRGCRGGDQGERQAGGGRSGPGRSPVDAGPGGRRLGEAALPGGGNGIVAAARGGAGGPQQCEDQQGHHDVGHQRAHASLVECHLKGRRGGPDEGGRPAGAGAAASGRRRQTRRRARTAAWQAAAARSGRRWRRRRRARPGPRGRSRRGRRGREGRRRG